MFRSRPIDGVYELSKIAEVTVGKWFKVECTMNTTLYILKMPISIKAKGGRGNEKN